MRLHPSLGKQIDFLVKRRLKDRQPSHQKSTPHSHVLKANRQPRQFPCMLVAKPLEARSKLFFALCIIDIDEQPPQSHMNRAKRIRTLRQNTRSGQIARCKAKSRFDMQRRRRIVAQGGELCQCCFRRRRKGALLKPREKLPPKSIRALFAQSVRHERKKLRLRRIKQHLLHSIQKTRTTFMKQEALPIIQEKHGSIRINGEQATRQFLIRRKFLRRCPHFRQSHRPIEKCRACSFIVRAHSIGIRHIEQIMQQRKKLLIGRTVVRFHERQNRCPKGFRLSRSSRLLQLPDQLHLFLIHPAFSPTRSPRPFRRDTCRPAPSAGRRHCPAR